MLSDYGSEPATIKYAKVGKSAGQEDASFVVCYEPDHDTRMISASVHVPLAPRPISDLLDVAGVLDVGDLAGRPVIVFFVRGDVSRRVVGFGSADPLRPACMFWR